ncbi:hypothetical protein GCK72_000954 [Caenorhabditis remanei]|uniref:DUF19 domain-containing protein n=1 Tax=Caenorhabditis remanei TaxID=31234 RepID=A0A6A5HLR1_CAERE|nr:hypothetical protein GCK72_000954 [Caenorhabditis remanei]KAF1769140.1 hypothetical protein GCK72_000954 [Caenorhabditis remanei]
MTSLFYTILILASFPLIYFYYGGSDDYSHNCSSQFENMQNVLDGILSGQSMKIHDPTEKLHLACTETIECFEKNIGEESDPGYQEWSKLLVAIKEHCDSLCYYTEKCFKCISKSQTTQSQLKSNSSTFQNQITFDSSEFTDDGPRGLREKHYVQE